MSPLPERRDSSQNLFTSLLINVEHADDDDATVWNNIEASLIKAIALRLGRKCRQTHQARRERSIKLEVFGT